MCKREVNGFNLQASIAHQLTVHPWKSFILRDDHLYDLNNDVSLWDSEVAVNMKHLVTEVMRQY